MERPFQGFLDPRKWKNVFLMKKKVIMMKNSSFVSGRLHKNYINVSTVAHSTNYHVYDGSGAWRSAFALVSAVNSLPRRRFLDVTHRSGKRCVTSKKRLQVRETRQWTAGSMTASETSRLGLCHADESLWGRNNCPRLPLPAWYGFAHA